MQKIFTAAIARSGTVSLAVLFRQFGHGCVVEHEPPRLLLHQLGENPFFLRHPGLRPRGRLAELGRGLQRRYIATDEMLGRGRALEWYDTGAHEELERLAHWRLRRIERFAQRGHLHYIESSQFFLRTYCYEVHRLIPDLGVIKLLRDPLETARSSANRKKRVFHSSLPPDRPSNVFRLTDWRDLTDFQLYAHLWIETELRWEAFLEATGLERHVVIETRHLSEPQRVAAVFAKFGIEHKPIVGLRATNTNTEARLPATAVSMSDTEAFLRVVDRLPANLRDRIPQLERFVPALVGTAR